MDIINLLEQLATNAHYSTDFLSVENQEIAELFAANQDEINFSRYVLKFCQDFHTDSLGDSFGSSFTTVTDIDLSFSLVTSIGLEQAKVV